MKQCLGHVSYVSWMITKLSQKWNVSKIVDEQCTYVIAMFTGILDLWTFYISYIICDILFIIYIIYEYMPRSFKNWLSDFFTWFDDKACKWKAERNSHCSLDVATTTTAITTSTTTSTTTEPSTTTTKTKALTVKKYFHLQPTATTFTTAKTTSTTTATAKATTNATTTPTIIKTTTTSTAYYDSDPKLDDDSGRQEVPGPDSKTLPSDPQKDIQNPTRNHFQTGNRALFRLKQWRSHESCTAVVLKIDLNS